MNDGSAVADIHQLGAQNDTLSADFTRTSTSGSHGMSQVEPPVVRELRQVVAGLRRETAAKERQIKELRGAIVTGAKAWAITPVGLGSG
jgi:hypothetical protein